MSLDTNTYDVKAFLFAQDIISEITMKVEALSEKDVRVKIAKLFGSTKALVCVTDININYEE